MIQLFILRNMAILHRATNWIQAKMGPALEARFGNELDLLRDTLEMLEAAA